MTTRPFAGWSLRELRTLMEELRKVADEILVEIEKRLAVYREEDADAPTR